MAATSLVHPPAMTPTPFRPYRRSTPPVISAASNSRPNSVRTISCAACIVNGSPTALEQASKKPRPKFFESTIPTENAPSRNRIKLFSGSANPALSQVKRKRFADGEIYFQLEESVRGCDVYLLQPTCPPVNDNLMELKIMIETCWSSSAKSITAVIPYFGYARADRRVQSREPITARIAARDISRANHVLVCDIHSLQSIGYFDIPVDHVQCEPVILDYLASKGLHSSNMVVVSPDVGGVARARAFAKKLGDAPLAIVDKRRHGHNIAEVMNLIGDVRGKVAILVDDMIDTAGTITKGAELLHKEGAKEVYACCTHAVFSPPAIERLSSGLFQEVIVTNTIPVADENYFPQLTVLSTATLLAETIWRLHNEYSVSSIFR
ncbi:Ribose-phosphate pyrophosphokinase 2-chloroplastic [Striga hermonthica]|uniref:ribose-phosphate diphosphokinase n=1 Tax=Striga hermonthica TaxID=68872 RepID=A0A9N7RCC3_STRHE|nr:Ribose-phosphate pyrophosphokinase 2-chloroplastic [Striga hermonthica]